MDNIELIKIADQLTGIFIPDMTMAEKNIAKMLVVAGILEEKKGTDEFTAVYIRKT